MIGHNRGMAGRPGNRNEVFCEAMAQAGLSIDALATAIDTTPKTIKSWRRGTVPRRPAFRAAVVDLLGVDAADLWPGDEDLDEPFLVTDATDEIVTAWSHRADAPKDVWWLLLDRATERIDLMAYAMQFLPEENPRLDRLLTARAATGCVIRIALADPDGPHVTERDTEERLGGTMPARIRTTLDHFQPLFGVEGIELRFYRTPMYNSLFRGDDQMLVTPHLYALKGYKAPLFHYRRVHDDGIFDNHLAHFERTWADATPIPVP